jgi:hypothetical protein
VPDPPDLPDVNAALLARWARAAAAPRLPSVGPARADASTVVTDAETPVQRRLQAFFEAATPVYQVPDGKGGTVEIAVATPFRMVGPDTAPPGTTNAVILQYAALEKRIEGHDRDLAAIARKYGLGNPWAIRSGRGTPGQVRALTQALINENKLPPAGPGVSLELRVRTMMSEYGIGFDCAGCVQQAFLAAQAITRARAGFAPILNESLSVLSRAHFSRVEPEASRAGDIVSLGPPENWHTGHRLIVIEQHEASPDEERRYRSIGDGSELGIGPLTVLTLGSSFGSNGDPARGGVGQQTWLYDGKKWGTVFPAPMTDGTTQEWMTVGERPYDHEHPLIGIYHYSEKL